MKVQKINLYGFQKVDQTISYFIVKINQDSVLYFYLKTQQQISFGMNIDFYDYCFYQAID